MSSHSTSRLRSRIFGLVGLVLVAGAWYFLAPQSIGGRVAYTVVTGQSMEPTLLADDLVVVREQPAYGTGDAIAFRSAALGRVVLHRIVGVERGRFVTQGDNNDYLDSDRPAERDVLGSIWVRIPRGGVVVNALRTPVGLAIISVTAVSFLGFFSVGQRRRRRGKHRWTADAAEDRPVPVPDADPVERVPGRRSTTSIRIAASCAALAVLAFTGLGLYSFGQPLFLAESVDVDYAHSGTFAYSAPAPGGPVYQDPQIEAGDPVYVRLVDRMQIGFDYELASSVPTSTELEGQMLAVLRTADGWKHEIKLAEGTATGAKLSLRGDLDLASIEQLLARIEKLTGMAPGTYSVTLEPRIDVTGTIAGKELVDTFRPVLPFRLNDIQLGLVREQSSGREVPLEEMLEPEEEGTISVDRAVAGPFAFAGRDLPALAVRRVAVAGAGTSLLALVAIALLWWSRRPADEAERIAARYGSLLIPVTDAPDLRHETVDVTDIETLARLAHQFEQPIMHRTLTDGSHSYVLCYDGLAYRYQIQAANPVLEVVDRPPMAPVHAVLTRPMVAVEDLPQEQEIGSRG